jgi:hypothetical protein
MAVVAIPLHPGAQARALLHHILANGDIVGRDNFGRTTIALAVDDWTLDQLLTFDAGSEDLEDADGEPDPDNEFDGGPYMVAPKPGRSGFNSLGDRARRNS